MILGLYESLGKYAEVVFLFFEKVDIRWIEAIPSRPKTFFFVDSRIVGYRWKAHGAPSPKWYNFLKIDLKH